MNRLPWFKFYPADWIKGTLSLTIEQKAVWIDLLCIAWEQSEQGIIRTSWPEIARAFRLPEDQARVIILSLFKSGFLDVFCTKCGSIFGSLVTPCHGGCHAHVTLMSRRMSRECHAREKNRERQQRHRESARLRKQRERLRRRNASVTDKKSEVRSQIPPKDIEKSVSLFTKPSLQDVIEYSRSIGFDFNAQTFLDHYDANGWKVGRNAMKDWRAAIRTWKARNGTFQQRPPKNDQEIPTWLKTQ